MPNTTNTTQTKFVVTVTPNDQRKRPYCYDFYSQQALDAFLAVALTNKQANYTVTNA